MVKHILMGALALLVGTAVAGAQSNDRLDELLGQAQARLDSTSYLVLAAGGLVAEDADPAAAFDQAVASGFLAKNRRPGDPVSVEDLSYLVMKALKVPGGLQWMLFPNPRAAYRELSAKQLINTSSGPGRLVAGDEVVRTLNGAVALKGGSR